MNNHSNIIHNSQKVETTKCLLTDEKIKKVHTRNGILFRIKKNEEKKKGKE